jgi:hypothetical protein
MERGVLFDAYRLVLFLEGGEAALKTAWLSETPMQATGFDTEFVLKAAGEVRM